MSAKDKLISDIISAEWDMFQNTTNIGGRASCQDNRPQFILMRRAQFSVWPEALLKSYFRDLTAAKEEGLNLITSKYAYMMKSTMPEYFSDIESRLPEITPEKQELVDRISSIHSKWSADFSEKYPYITGQGRPTSSEADGPQSTSVETYTKGEMLTYSVETLRLYRDFTDQMQAEDRNMVYEVRENIVKAMGYTDIASAEETLAQLFSTQSR